jgi:hypothetical protein
MTQQPPHDQKLGKAHPQPGQKNEGEGNKTAARRYNEDQQEFVKEGRVDEAAKKARDAVEGKEGDELEQAEEEGRSHAREADADKDYARQSKLKQ